MSVELSWFIVINTMVSAYGVYQIGKDIHRWFNSKRKCKYMVRRIW